jgi:hypothetical protein
MLVPAMSPLPIAFVLHALALGSGQPATDVQTGQQAIAPPPDPPAATQGPMDQPAVAPPAPSFQPPPPPPPPPEPLRARYGRYGDRGSTEIALGVGYSSLTGFLAAAGWRTFVVDGIAPGVEATYVSGGAGGTELGLLMAALRLVPVRTSRVALVLTGRAGRVLLAQHDDGWGAGGGVGVILFLFQGGGVELGYEALKLLRARFCADLSSCVISGPVVGLRLTF